MPTKARVRGIYSTALSKLLHDNGIELVDVSPVIAERLKIDSKRGEPADVTVKSDENDPSQILILGFPEQVEEISNILESNIPQVIVYKPKIGLYSCFKTKIIGKVGRDCIAQTPIGKAVLVDEPECVPDKEVSVTVVKVPVKPGERIVVSSRVRVVGKYAIVGRGSGVSFSNFIRNKERISQLLQASSKYVREGYSIRWRSNADEANLTEIMAEIPQLITKLIEVEKLLANADQLEIVYTGEFMRLIELTYESKQYLDEVRGSVTPTSPYHHILRSGEYRSEGIVDLLDIVAKDIPKERIEKWIRLWIAHRIMNRRDISLHHKRLLKKNLILGKTQPYEIVSITPLSIKLYRNVKSPGIYDGLEVPKEPGDHIITEVKEGAWHIVHKYFSKEDSLKGIYININTPPELLPHGQVKYVDLEVDLVKRPAEGCRIIDTEGFRELIKEELISGDLVERVIQEIESLLSTYCVATE